MWLIVIAVNFTINPVNTTTFAGKSTKLQCVVIAYPYANITWYKDDIAVPSDKYSTSSSNVGVYIKVTSGIELSSINISDSGRYQCKAINKLGEFLSQEAFLTVNCKWSEIIKRYTKFDV